MIEKILSKIFVFLERAYYNQQYLSYRKKYTLSDTFRFNGRGILFYGPGRIEISENTYMGDLSTIQASADCKVSIGKNCSISHNVRIYTENYNPDDIISECPPQTKKGNVTIGNGVWIGANSFIREGIQIGDFSVIGANSVVTKDIPCNSIAAGSPAKVIRKK